MLLFRAPRGTPPLDRHLRERLAWIVVLAVQQVERATVYVDDPDPGPWFDGGEGFDCAPFYLWCVVPRGLGGWSWEWTSPAANLLQTWREHDAKDESRHDDNDHDDEEEAAAREKADEEERDEERDEEERDEEEGAEEATRDVEVADISAWSSLAEVDSQSAGEPVGFWDFYGGGFDHDVEFSVGDGVDPDVTVAVAAGLFFTVSPDSIELELASDLDQSESLNNDAEFDVAGLISDLTGWPAEVVDEDDEDDDVIALVDAALADPAVAVDDASDTDSAARLLSALVNGGALVLHTGVARPALCERVAPHLDDAAGLVAALVADADVDEVFVDVAALAALLARW